MGRGILLAVIIALFLLTLIGGGIYTLLPALMLATVLFLTR